MDISQIINLFILGAFGTSDIPSEYSVDKQKIKNLK